MPHVGWIEPQQPFPVNSVILLDVAKLEASRDLRVHSVARMLIGKDRLEGIPVMPYPMFPRHILDSSRGQLEALRARLKAGVFFAGNQQSRYGRTDLQSRFGVLPRLQMLSVLRERFPHRISTRSADGQSDRIVLRDSSRDPVDQQSWMNELADHRFFLCCPGASQPICHHLIESMSVGLIPILEYGDRLTPKLVDGENAICFKGPAGLVEAIERADRLSMTELERLSAGVARYYDEHLAGASFLARVRDDDLLGDSGAVMMPFHNENLFDEVALGRPEPIAA